MKVPTFVSGNQAHYFDTSTLLDLDEFDLIKSLCNIDAVIVEEVLDEIHNKTLKDKLKMLTDDRGPRKRAYVPGADRLDDGEVAVIRAMLADERECVYISNDRMSVEFVRSLSAEGMDTSDFVIRLHSFGYVTDDDIRRILDSDSRRPNRTCRKRLTELPGMARNGGARNMRGPPSTDRT